MGNLTLQGATSGQITLAPTAVAGTNTLTLPALTGTVGISGPAFRAEVAGTQTGLTSTVFTKVTFSTETFDTNNNFASSTFTPTVAGYYQINANANATVTSTPTNITSAIYKNGSVYSQLWQPNYNTTQLGAFLSDIVYCNGSTDYIEMYIRVNSLGTITVNTFTNFSGAFLRSI